MPQASVTTSALEILPTNPERKTIYFRHIGTAGTIRLSNEKTGEHQAATSPWVLRPGDGFAISARGKFSDRVGQRWTASSNTGTISLAYDELFGEDTTFDIAVFSGGQSITESDMYFSAGGTFEAWTGLAGKGPYVIQRDHYSEEVVIANSETLPTGQTLMTLGEDISAFDKTSINVKSNVTVTVRPQLSDDNVSWYDPKTLADADISYSVTNEGINFPLDRNGKYFRLSITNNSGSTATITAAIMGQA